MHDITQAEALMAQVEPAALLGDKGYDVDHLIQSLTAREIRVVIPPNPTGKSDVTATSLFTASAISSSASSA